MYMRWRREAIHKLNEKACRTSAVAIAPKSTSLRAFVAAGWVELLPPDFGPQNNIYRSIILTSTGMGRVSNDQRC